MTDTTTKRTKGDKLRTAIRLINENPTMVESEIGALIANTLGIKLGNAIHNYYKAPIRKGLCNIKARVLDVGKKPRKRTVKSKEVPAKTEVAKADVVTNGAGVVKVVPVAKPKFTPEEVAKFQEGLARARARVKPLQVDANGEPELPASLRRKA